MAKPDPRDTAPLICPQRPLNHAIVTEVMAAVISVFNILIATCSVECVTFRSSDLLRVTFVAFRWEATHLSRSGCQGSLLGSKWARHFPFLHYITLRRNTREDFTQTASEACVCFYGKIITTAVVCSDERGEDSRVGKFDTIELSDADILRILV